ncbi:hypothetical protein [Pseudoalteromonas maricaloris]|uniref:Uncharacterized protein n=1 Tax=Pseudoalteromonas maricaloris TaxID=184924 RepID=A0A8I2KNT9_9GAMM|nr:hypothetical protein [Pseudoalteromonas maricaloris]NLR23151.1 hypothetical protein [Pseudoalteromonas maricaloris]NLR23566.1 hypothetical protein [Pseudoalteromonas maricaloris]WOX26913.1 hypothetical protein R5H13_09540 [Pseudoalteromonas maricaloris]WOX31385.1 hypothetical protein R5H13_20820 [Pseudoalteromonas maricaloris]
MGNFISKNLSLGLTLYAVYWLYKKIDSTTKPLTETAGNALAEIQMWANGSHPIHRAWAGFFLDTDKLTHDYYLKDELWYEAIDKLHDGNKLLLDEIFDPNMQVKPKYHVLLDNEVSPKSIATVNRR